MNSPDSFAPTAVRTRYSGDQLDTASNAKILTLCFDRLDRDLATAQTALERGDHYSTNEQLSHAQDLLGEVANMVVMHAWDHATSLLAVYDYVLRLLAVANIKKDSSLVAEAQHILSEIGDAFRVARTETTQIATAAAPSAGNASSIGEEHATPRFSVRA